MIQTASWNLVAVTGPSSKEPERAEALQHLRDLTKRRNLTLLTATKQADISEAAVLAELLGG